MALEQTVKELQAQNAQLQEIIQGLSKGQEELKTLLLEKNKKEKKDKQPISYINMGRRFKGQASGTKIEIPANNGDETDDESEDEKDNTINLGDDYYEDEQYSPRDDKYKLLEERM